MKFAFLIFKVFKYGGAQRDMLRIARDLLEMGHEVTVLTGEWRDTEAPVGLEYRVLPSRGFTNHQHYQSLIQAMQAELAKGGFDFVVGFNRMPNLDAYFMADPCFASRKVNPFYKFTPRYRFFKKAEEAVFGAQSHAQLLMLNQADQAIFQRYYATPEHRFHLIPPHVPQAKFAHLNKADCRAYLRNSFNLPAEAKVILTVGSAYKRKGVDRAMLGVANLPENLRVNTWLIALGEHESASTFDEDAKKLGIAAQCILAGGRDDVATLMVGADVLAHPARSELAGLVLIESLVAGLPAIVSTDCGYAPHISTAQGGIVLATPYKQGDFDTALQLALSSKICDVKASETYVKKLAKESLQAEARLLEAWAKTQVYRALLSVENVSLPSQLYRVLTQQNVFDYFMQCSGKIFRDVKGRKTMRIHIDGKSYFIKQHFGVGWAEIFKNLLTLKKPILGAMTEVAAIQKFTNIGIATTPLVAYGKRGCNPASQQSFVLTQDLGDINSLEDIVRGINPQKISKAFRRKIIVEIARIAATLHKNGVCHQDFYLCHFAFNKAEFARETLNFYVVDLHRVLMGETLNGNGALKDIAGLYFSSMEANLTLRDLALFKQYYLPQSAAFWAQVEARAQSLLTKFNSQKFQDKLATDRAKLG